MRRSLPALVPAFLILVVVALAATSSAEAGTVTYENTLARTGSGQVTIRVYKAVSFQVRLRVPTQGRARLYLLGVNAPRGGPLIDTSTASCEGAAGSFYCEGAYEPLPKGTYTFRIVWRGPQAAPVELTVRW
jgi:hypothetical protein